MREGEREIQRPALEKKSGKDTETRHRQKNREKHSHTHPVGMEPTTIPF